MHSIARDQNRQSVVKQFSLSAMKTYPKYKRKYLDQRCDYSLELPNVDNAPHLIVVIPAYDESIDDVSACFDSLAENDLSNELCVQVLLLINYPENTDAQIRDKSIELYNTLSQKLSDWNKAQMNFRIFIQEMKEEESGVGWARKKLMDLAFRIYEAHSTQGVIVNLDADCVVESDYCSAIYTYFQSNRTVEAASIAFEHPLSDSSAESEAITLYELHLRYFINMQRQLGLPFAYQTVGSAMAVRSESYVQNGGMNKRKAGEDFYFLHKYTKRLSIGEISSTVVKASHRRSERVPFGTGKAVGSIMDAEIIDYSTYNFKSFFMIQEFIGYSLEVLLEAIDLNSYQKKVLSTRIYPYLNQQNTITNLRELMDRTADIEERIKVFFTWFDAFRLMKVLHYIRDELNVADISIEEAIKHLFQLLDLEYHEHDMRANLEELRAYDRNDDYRNAWRERLNRSKKSY